MSRFATALLPLLTLVACASQEAMLGDETGEGVDTGGDDTALEDPDGDGDETPEPEWFAVGGTLVLTGDAADAEASELDVQLHLTPGDAEQGEAQEPICASPTVEAIEAAEPPEAAVLAWWTVALAPDSACAWSVGTLELGIGRLDPQLHPAMAAAGLETEGSTLYGLYARHGETSPVWVFGVAGTEANLDGSSAPVSEPPLPDGTYTLRTLHLLPLEQPESSEAG